jgi:hypothetical protein
VILHCSTLCSAGGSFIPIDDQASSNTLILNQTTNSLLLVIPYPTLKLQWFVNSVNQNPRSEYITALKSITVSTWVSKVLNELDLTFFLFISFFTMLEKTKQHTCYISPQEKEGDVIWSRWILYSKKYTGFSMCKKLYKTL